MLRLRLEELEPRCLLSGPPDHVVVVVEENHSLSEIIGSPAAAYINGLAQSGAGAGRQVGEGLTAQGLLRLGDHLTGNGFDEGLIQEVDYDGKEEKAASQRPFSQSVE